MSAAEASKKFKRAEKRSGKCVYLWFRIYIAKMTGYRATSSEDALRVPSFPNLI